MAAERFTLRCDLCKGRRRLWLRGPDYLECPQCAGAGVIEVVQSRAQARVQERFTPSASGGLMKQTKILLPHGSGWSD